jgi:hypothetical protein
LSGRGGKVFSWGHGDYFRYKINKIFKNLKDNSAHAGRGAKEPLNYLKS